MSEGTNPAWRRLPPTALRNLHWIALILEEARQPLAAAEIARRMLEVGVSFAFDPETSVVKAIAGRGPIRKTGDRTYAFDPLSQRMEILRWEVEESLIKNGLATRRVALSPDERDQRQRAAALELTRVRQEYQSWRKVFLRTVFAGSHFLFGATLDRDSREFLVFSDSEELRRWLTQADLILGLKPEEQLRRLDLFPPVGRVVDITPPIRSKVVNKSGRKVQFSLDYVLKNNTGRTVAPDAQLQEYHQRGERGKLTRRVLADLKTLDILYLYGQGHGYLRLDWGFLHEIRELDWGNSRWEPGIGEVIGQGIDEGRDVDIVLGQRIGWENPWARAWRVKPLELGYHRLRFATPECEEQEVSLSDVFLARLAD